MATKTTKAAAKPKATKTLKSQLIGLIGEFQKKQDSNPTEAKGNAIASLRNALHLMEGEDV